MQTHRGELDRRLTRAMDKNNQPTMSLHPNKT
mgnify:CR=1 FL=1